MGPRGLPSASRIGIIVYSSKRPKGGLGTSRGHPVPPPRGFGPVRGGHRGHRDGPQHEAPSLLESTRVRTTVKGLNALVNTLDSNTGMRPVLVRDGCWLGTVKYPCAFESSHSVPKILLKSYSPGIAPSEHPEVLLASATDE